MTEKILPLPHNYDAEKFVLGACIRDGRLVSPLMDLLPTAAIYSAQLQIMLAAMYNMASRGEFVDIVTLADVLDRRRELGTVGGRAQLMDLADAVSSTAGIRAHARIVVEYWISRETIRLTRELHERSWHVTEDYSKAVALMRDLAEDLAKKAKLLDRIDASEALR